MVFRVIFFIALTGMLTPVTLPAAESGLHQSAPEAQSSSQASASASDALHNRPSTRLPSSTNSKSAWINQGEWLFGRLGEKGLRIGDPLHIRIFKQSRELELYVRGQSGFELYRTYPICDMSGTLGPKRFEGDYQAPEGFYTVAAERLHPHSDFHLAFNLGYPNAFDRAAGRTGSNIMIHGGCASNGCFAMTNYYMEQIYILTEAALHNGQDGIGVEIYPFRLTPENLAANASSRWIDFWRSLKPAHDHFAEFGTPASIRTEAGSYRVFSGQQPSVSKPGRLSAP